jgi:hypothetical protein
LSKNPFPIPLEERFILKQLRAVVTMVPFDCVAPSTGVGSDRNAAHCLKQVRASCENQKKIDLIGTY